MHSEVIEGRLGTTLRGKYRLDRVLGVGGMAAVYAATHRNKKRVAVKVLHVELSHHEAIRTRFLREGYVANTVDHPGAVAVMDDDIAEDGSAFLVMDLLEGISVDQLVKGSGPLDARTVLGLSHQLLGVLEAAHAKGIIHRDIKPANLFVAADGTLKVLDFGIARLREPDGSGSDSGSATASGVMLGTPAFMPPEQARGESAMIDERTDLWAAGATMFTLATGRYVHHGGTGSMLLVRAATEHAPPLASVLPDAASELAQIVDRALAFDKEHRFADATEMREAVAAAFSRLFGEPPVTHALPASAMPIAVRAVPSEPPATADTSVPHRRRGRGALILGGVAALGLLAISVAVAVRATAAPRAVAFPTTPAGEVSVSASASAAAAATGTGNATAAAAETGAAPMMSAPVASAAASGALASSARPHGAVTRVAAPSTRPSRPAAKNCDPPYVLDANGKRTYKDECM